MCILAVGYGINAQDLKEGDVPSAVKTKFSSLYPGVKKVKWEKENGNYEAEIYLNKVETSILFDINGNQLQTETEISVSELPQGVKEYASKNLKNSKIKEAAKIVDASGVVTYEAEIKNRDYIFDANGNFIKMDSEEGDNEKEDDDNK